MLDLFYVDQPYPFEFPSFETKGEHVEDCKVTVMYQQHQHLPALIIVYHMTIPNKIR